MFKLLSLTFKPHVAGIRNHQKNVIRTFLSQSYYCREVWEDRLNSPILQKVNLDVLYHELDQRFQKTRRISAVDVDIFANAVKDDLFIDEMMDLVHKLRLSPDTGNMLNSTSHAVIRALLKHNKIEELLQALDDRLNYGLFLDDYTANILMDNFWKTKNFVAGSVVASQIMLQEDFKHPLTTSLSLLHCYNYLLKPEDWPQPPKPEEPEEEVKVRVKYLRNPYNDDHFDLREPRKIVGKTLAMATKNSQNNVHKSLRIIGLALFGKEDLAKKELEDNKNIKLVKEVIEVVPEELDIKKDLIQLQLESEDVQSMLQKQVTESIATTSEKDIANQCSLYVKWENERLQSLEEQKKRLVTAERLAEIDRIKKSLKEKEQKLWFFENEENIELTIEETAAALPTKKTEKVAVEENYVPPEVITRKSD